jgi:hypothetical protein
MKNFMYACVALAALASAVHFASSSAQAQATPPGQQQVVRSTSAGRWSIVNGTPQYARNIMLLDTATGQTWTKCADKDGAEFWCYVTRTMAPTANSDTSGASDEAKK